MTTCRKCKYLVNPTGKRIMRDKVYECSVPLPSIEMPHCVTAAYGYKQQPDRSWISPDREHNCSYFDREDKSE